MTVVAPNEEESKFLRNLATRRKSATRISPEKTRGSEWVFLVENASDVLSGVDPALFSEVGSQQLKYHLLLGRLVGSKMPIGELELTAADSENLLAAFETEFLILRHEIEMARGDTAMANATEQEILLHRERGIDSLDFLQSLTGVIARFRSRAR
jgi:hypothetical protein